MGITQYCDSNAILVPKIGFMTNNAWPVVRGTANGFGTPLLLMDRYSKGALYVLTIPENFDDLYPHTSASSDSDQKLPPPKLSHTGGCPQPCELVRYDNAHFVVESFCDAPVNVMVSIAGITQRIRDMTTGAVINGTPALKTTKGQMPSQEPRTSFRLTVMPHSFVALAEEPAAQ